MSPPPASRIVPIAVLDSSVLVSVWSRIALQNVAAEPEAPFVPAWSEWIIAERWRVLTQKWIVRHGRANVPDVGRLEQAANDMLRYLIPVMKLVSLRDFTGPAPWPELTDLNDAPIWQTAVVAGAQYVVSQNIHDFPPLVGGRHLYGGIEYVTPVEFMEDVLGLSAVAVHGGPLPAGALLRSRRTDATL